MRGSSPREDALEGAADGVLDDALDRAAVVEAMRRLEQLGLNRGTSGNVSVRRPDGRGCLITPSGVEAEALAVDDVVDLADDGVWAAPAGRTPSSEWRIHRDLYRARPDVGAVVHTHPVNATAVAVHGRGLPPFHYLVGLGGGRDIPCAAYATFGSAALSEAVLEAMDGRRACLMAHHGAVATGPDLPSAMHLAVQVEQLAAQYLAACQLGEPPLLDDARMDEALARFGAGPGYGVAPPT